MEREREIKGWQSHWVWRIPWDTNCTMADIWRKKEKTQKYDNYDDMEDLVMMKWVRLFQTTLDTQTFWQKVDIGKPQYVRKSVTKCLHEPDRCLNRLWTFEWTTGERERVGDDCELQQFLFGCWRQICWRWEMELWNWHRMRTALGQWILQIAFSRSVSIWSFWPYNFLSSS